MMSQRPQSCTTTLRPKEPGTDAADVAATKAARDAALPVFVVIQDAARKGLRHVRMGWVEDWDDDAREFLIAFGEEPPIADLPAPDDQFEPLVKRRKKYRGRKEQVRPDQARFSMRVRQRYGNSCAFCDLALAELLEAAHLVPWSEGGSDDPRNGLTLCRNHHSALEARLVAIDPRSLEIVVRDGLPIADLRLTRGSIKHLPAFPHPKSLQHLWESWTSGTAGEAPEHGSAEAVP
jgi:hypothetical protein